MSKTKLYYLWFFKPGEKQQLPYGSMNHNSQYIKDHQVVTSENIDGILQQLTEEFPTITDIFAKIPDKYWVIKTDLVRLLVIYLQGGYYSDIDCFIKQHLPLVRGVSLFIEQVVKSVNNLGPRECKNEPNLTRIANFFFGSTIPKHPFYKACIQECLIRLECLFTENNESLTNSDILWVCGPDVITTVYHRERWENVTLFDQSFLTHKCYSSWR